MYGLYGTVDHMVDSQRLYVLADTLGKARGGDILDLVFDNEPSCEVIEHPFCSPATLEKASRAADNPRIRAAILTHPSCPRPLRDALATEEATRQAASPNPTVIWEGHVTDKDAAAIFRTWSTNPEKAYASILALGPGDRRKLLQFLVSGETSASPQLLGGLWLRLPHDTFLALVGERGEEQAIASLAEGVEDINSLAEWLSSSALHRPVTLASTLGAHVRAHPQPWSRLNCSAGQEGTLSVGAWQVLANHPFTDSSLLKSWILSEATPAWVAHDACRNPALTAKDAADVSRAAVDLAVAGDTRLLNVCASLILPDDALDLPIGLVCEGTAHSAWISPAVRSARRAVADAIAQAADKDLALWALNAPGATRVRQVLDIFTPQYT